VLGPEAEDGDMPRFSIEPRQKVWWTSLE